MQYLATAEYVKVHTGIRFPETRPVTFRATALQTNSPGEFRIYSLASSDSPTNFKEKQKEREEEAADRLNLQLRLTLNSFLKRWLAKVLILEEYA